MVSSYPHHNIESWMQMQSFYEGLLDSQRMMVDATSGEGLMNKTAPTKVVVSEAVTGLLGNKVEVQDQSFAEHMLE
ncbi:unnamed protein product [Prunus armeniaca]